MSHSLPSPSQTATSHRAMLIGLMSPVIMTVLNMTMIGVALPAIRDTYNSSADVTAWFVTAYTLSFALFMPLYGRFGDDFGKKRLMLSGISIFLCGTVLIVFAPGVGWFLVGRLIQGMGVAGMVPLGMAIITQRFPPEIQGKMLGTWNSAGPIAGMVGPVLAGIIIDQIAWRSIFGPVILMGLLAMVIVGQIVPGRSQPPVPRFLREFDWLGVLLLMASMTAFIFYISSRPITGVPALQDWRLLAMTLVFLGSFIAWEKHRPTPFIQLALFGLSNFSTASLTACLRMFIMGSVGFLVPLYLADIHQLNASATGLVLTIHASSLLITMRMGGQIADQIGSRRPVVMGLTGQGLAMVYLSVLPADWPVLLAIVGIVGQGLAAGFSLAALHRSALSSVPLKQSGSAAGLYSMLRFSGLMIGSAISGVVLQAGIDANIPLGSAYHYAFAVVAIMAFLGMGVGTRLK